MSKRTIRMVFEFDFDFEQSRFGEMKGAMRKTAAVSYVAGMISGAVVRCMEPHPAGPSPLLDWRYVEAEVVK